MVPVEGLVCEGLGDSLSVADSDFRNQSLLLEEEAAGARAGSGGDTE